MLCAQRSKAGSATQWSVFHHGACVSVSIEACCGLWWYTTTSSTPSPSFCTTSSRVSPTGSPWTKIFVIFGHQDQLRTYLYKDVTKQQWRRGGNTVDKVLYQCPWRVLRSTRAQECLAVVFCYFSDRFMLQTDKKSLKTDLSTLRGNEDRYLSKNRFLNFEFRIYVVSISKNVNTKFSVI